VKIADAHDIPFFATGGGHGISDYSAFDGIAIDLGNFKLVHLSASENIVTIGAAAEFSQLSDVLYEAGKELRECSPFRPLSSYSLAPGVVWHRLT
jgi:fumiquinazoline A oxidase